MTDAARDGGALDAGTFSDWRATMRAALVEDADAEVPCGACTACCTSRQFVHIAPTETRALAAIPAELLFPAPRMPKGHVLLGYDERGHCPMLVDGACSIYPDRPRACRTYDCRVLAAAGVDVRDDGKPAIADRVARWRFALPTAEDREGFEAVRSAADFLADHADELPEGIRPPTSTARAVAAFLVHGQFLAGSPPEVADVVAALTEAARQAG